MTTDISLDGLQEVSQDSFFKSLGGHNVYLSTTTDYPYTTTFETGDGKVIGKIIRSYVSKNKWPLVRHYYITNYKE